MFNRYENGKPVQDFKPADPEPSLTPGGFVDEPRAWRVERYLELNFSELHAELLADVRDQAVVADRGGTLRTWTFPLHWGKIAKLLEQGAQHDQIVAIYA